MLSGGSYCTFAGKECARALAIMKVEADECNDNLEELTEKDLKVLDDWIKKFEGKYSIVGKVTSNLCTLHSLICPCLEYPANIMSSYSFSLTLQYTIKSTIGQLQWLPEI